LCEITMIGRFKMLVEVEVVELELLVVEVAEEPP
jgi:hypothetical protein